MPVIIGQEEFKSDESDTEICEGCADVCFKDCQEIPCDCEDSEDCSECTDFSDHPEPEEDAKCFYEDEPILPVDFPYFVSEEISTQNCSFEEINVNNYYTDLRWFRFVSFADYLKARAYRFETYLFRSGGKWDDPTSDDWNPFYADLKKDGHHQPKRWGNKTYKYFPDLAPLSTPFVWRTDVHWGNLAGTRDRAIEILQDSDYLGQIKWELEDRAAGTGKDYTHNGRVGHDIGGDNE